MSSMWIKSLRVSKFRSHSFDLKFGPIQNLLVGINGCGKSTVLHLISILTGPYITEKLADYDERFDEISITVQCRYDDALLNKDYTLKLNDTFDWDKINEFKSRLPARTSYVLHEDLWEDRFVSLMKNPADAFRDLQDRLMHISQNRFVARDIGPSHGHSLLLSETGAARNLLTTGMRIPPAGIPMLIESPERSLHITSRERIDDFYNDNDENQIIYTTHCPSVYNGLSSRGAVVIDIAAMKKAFK